MNYSSALLEQFSMDWPIVFVFVDSNKKQETSCKFTQLKGTKCKLGLVKEVSVTKLKH